MKNVKVAVAGLCLLGAIVIYFSRGAGAGDEAIPDTKDSETQWLCRKCNHAYMLTARKADDAARAAGGQMPLICPKCSAKDAWRAAFCSTHNRLYLSADAPGSPGVCPQCQPARKPTRMGTDDDTKPGTATKAPAPGEVVKKKPVVPNM